MTNEEILQEIRELQQIQLSILLDVKKICDEHNISFFLGEGTMLGAIRHKGFIPWDDDIDLIMPRMDYEKFLKVAPQLLGDKYEVQHSTTVENYWSPFIKVRLLNHDGKFKQKHIAHLTDNNGPYIDIFPIEYTNKNSGLSFKLTGFFVRYYRGLLSYKMGIRKPRRWPGRLLRFVSKFYSVKAIHASLVRTLKPYCEPNKKYMVTFLTYHPLNGQIVEAINYEKTIQWDFEGHKMPVPSGYDTILTTIYGDYMTPPPEDQRIVKHHFYDAEGH